jgi:septum formation topological specificity factor MinE
MAETAEQRLQNVIAQEAERQKALQLLASLRQEAATEIDRLISFLDASDDYVTTELECTDDPTDEECREVGKMGAHAQCSKDFEPSWAGPIGRRAGAAMPQSA